MSIGASKMQMLERIRELGKENNQLKADKERLQLRNAEYVVAATHAQRVIDQLRDGVSHQDELLKGANARISKLTDQCYLLREEVECYEAMKEGVTQRVSDLETELQTLKDACMVFITPSERLRDWDEYKEYAARLILGHQPLETDKCPQSTLNLPENPNDAAVVVVATVI
jgi:chromosome segregation ATPase